MSGTVGIFSHAVRTEDGKELHVFEGSSYDGKHQLVIRDGCYGVLHLNDAQAKALLDAMVLWANYNGVKNE